MTTSRTFRLIVPAGRSLALAGSLAIAVGSSGCAGASVPASCNGAGKNPVTAFQLADRVCTDSGLIAGTAGADPAVTIFKGIPYAAPPIGDLRWQAPHPVVPWTDLRKADTFGNNAMQPTPAPHEWWTE